MKDSWIWLSHW